MGNQRIKSGFTKKSKAPVSHPKQPSEAYKLIYGDDKVQCIYPLNKGVNEKVIPGQKPLADKEDKHQQKEMNDIRQSFQMQFYKLLDKFGDIELPFDKVSEQELKKYKLQIKEIKKNIFNESYSGNQPSNYFESIKNNFENIYLILTSEQVSIDIKLSAYKNLCEHLHVCAPGLFTHIEEALDSISPILSIEAWLADYRTKFIESYAKEYHRAHNLTEGNQVHTVNAFVREAKGAGWNPKHDTEFQEFGNLANIKPEDIKKFIIALEDSYTPIKLFNNMYDRMNTILLNMISNENEKIVIINNETCVEYRYVILCRFNDIVKKLFSLTDISSSEYLKNIDNIGDPPKAYLNLKINLDFFYKHFINYCIKNNIINEKIYRLKQVKVGTTDIDLERFFPMPDPSNPDDKSRLDHWMSLTDHDLRNLLEYLYTNKALLLKDNKDSSTDYIISLQKELNVLNKQLEEISKIGNTLDIKHDSKLNLRKTTIENGINSKKMQMQSIIHGTLHIEIYNRFLTVLLSHAEKIGKFVPNTSEALFVPNTSEALKYLIEHFKPELKTSLIDVRQIFTNFITQVDDKKQNDSKENYIKKLILNELKIKDNDDIDKILNSRVYLSTNYVLEDNKTRTIINENNWNNLTDIESVALFYIFYDLYKDNTNSLNDFMKQMQRHALSQDKSLLFSVLYQINNFYSDKKLADILVDLIEKPNILEKFISLNNHLNNNTLNIDSSKNQPLIRSGTDNKPNSELKSGTDNKPNSELKYPIDINNALIKAVEKNYLKSVNVLLDYRPSLNLGDINQDDFIIIAARANALEVLEEIIIRLTPIDPANENYLIKINNIKNLKTLQAKKISGDLKKYVNTTCKSAHLRFTPLVHAVINNNSKMIKLLIKSGANIDTPVGTGNYTSIEIAIINKRHQAFDILLNHQPDNFDKHNLIKKAIEEKNLYVLKKFIPANDAFIFYELWKRKVEVPQQVIIKYLKSYESKNETPDLLIYLFIDIEEPLFINEFNKIILLMDHASLNGIDKSGDTILHLSIRKKNYEIMRRLLRSDKVDINSQNASKHTPLQLAEDMKDPIAMSLIKTQPSLSNVAYFAHQLVNLDDRNILNKLMQDLESELQTDDKMINLSMIGYQINNEIMESKQFEDQFKKFSELYTPKKIVDFYFVLLKEFIKNNTLNVVNELLNHNNMTSISSSEVSSFKIYPYLLESKIIDLLIKKGIFNKKNISNDIIIINNQKFLISSYFPPTENKWYLLSFEYSVEMIKFGRVNYSAALDSFFSKLPLASIKLFIQHADLARDNNVFKYLITFIKVGDIGEILNTEEYLKKHLDEKSQHKILFNKLGIQNVEDIKEYTFLTSNYVEKCRNLYQINIINNLSEEETELLIFCLLLDDRCKRIFYDVLPDGDSFKLLDTFDEYSIEKLIFRNDYEKSFIIFLHFHNVNDASLQNLIALSIKNNSIKIMKHLIMRISSNTLKNISDDKKNYLFSIKNIESIIAENRSEMFQLVLDSSLVSKSDYPSLIKSTLTNINCLSILLNKFRDDKLEFNDKNTILTNALCAAIASNHPKAAKMLCDAGANIWMIKSDKLLVSPLEFVVFHKMSELLSLLLIKLDDETLKYTILRQNRSLSTQYYSLLSMMITNQDVTSFELLFKAFKKFDLKTSIIKHFIMDNKSHHMHDIFLPIIFKDKTSIIQACYPTDSLSSIVPSILLQKPEYILNILNVGITLDVIMDFILLCDNRIYLSHQLLKVDDLEIGGKDKKGEFYVDGISNIIPIHMFPPQVLQNVVNEVDEKGNSLLSRYIIRSSNSPVNPNEVIDTIKKLLLEGADVNQKNKNGDTPLHVAIKNLNGQAVRQLSSVSHFDYNSKNNQGYTVYGLACHDAYRDSIDACKLLVNRFNTFDLCLSNDTELTNAINHVTRPEYNFPINIINDLINYAFHKSNNLEEYLFNLNKLNPYIDRTKVVNKDNVINSNYLYECFLNYLCDQNIFNAKLIKDNSIKLNLRIYVKDEYFPICIRELFWANLPEANLIELFNYYLNQIKDVKQSSTLTNDILSSFNYIIENASKNGYIEFLNILFTKCTPDQILILKPLILKVARDNTKFWLSKTHQMLEKSTHVSTLTFLTDSKSVSPAPASTGTATMPAVNTDNNSENLQNTPKGPKSK